MGQEKNPTVVAEEAGTPLHLLPPHRRYACAACRVSVVLCSSCDRGNIYCPSCAPGKRRERVSRAQHRYRLSEHGRKTRRVAAKRRRSELSAGRVGDRGSPQSEAQGNASSGQPRPAGEPVHETQSVPRFALAKHFPRIPTAPISLQCAHCGQPCSHFSRQGSGFRFAAWKAAQRRRFTLRGPPHQGGGP